MSRSWEAELPETGIRKLIQKKGKPEWWVSRFAGSIRTARGAGVRMTCVGGSRGNAAGSGLELGYSGAKGEAAFAQGRWRGGGVRAGVRSRGRGQRGPPQGPCGPRARAGGGSGGTGSGLGRVRALKQVVSRQPGVRDPVEGRPPAAPHAPPPNSPGEAGSGPGGTPGHRGRRSSDPNPRPPVTDNSKLRPGRLTPSRRPAPAPPPALGANRGARRSEGVAGGVA